MDQSFGKNQQQDPEYTNQPLLIMSQDYQVFLKPRMGCDIYSFLIEDSLSLKREISGISQIISERDKISFQYIEEKKLNDQQIPTNIVQKQSFSSSIKCKCSKSHCLKNYCECYKAGNPCSQSCGCINCSNVTVHKIQKNNRSKCKCKKSHCLKNYCQCHNAGQKCSQECGCLQCKNHQQETEESGSQGIKKRKHSFEINNPQIIYPLQKIQIAQNII